MVSRVTTALLLALAASNDAAGAAARRLFTAARSPAALSHGGDAAYLDAARALAAATREVAPLPAAASRRALAAASGNATAAANSTTPQFVTVAADGSTFELDGKKFIVVGANQYAMMMTATWDWDGVEILLDQASSLGLNVLRTWAFGERPANGNPKTPALQVAPGQYDEAMMAALDRVVFEAGKRGLRLLLALSNNWDAYGGAPAYISWAAAAGEAIGMPTAPDASPFFTSPHCKATFKAFMATLLNRVNTFSGVAYKDDPAIFAFDLMNEPRVAADPSGATLGAWIAEMAAEFKRIDGNHLLTIGAEGFFGQSTPELAQYNPQGDNASGNDFVAHHSLKDIDYASLHIWADQWLQCCTVECLMPFLDQWVTSHIEAADSIGKPLVVEEFGAKMRCFPHGQSSSLSGDSTGSSQTTRRLAARTRIGAAKPAASPPQLPSPTPAKASPPPTPPPSPPPTAPPPFQPPASPPPSPPPAPPPPSAPPPASPPPPVSPSEPPTPPQLLLRTEMYKMIYSRGAGAVAAGRSWGGSLFWLLGIDGAPDADHYTLYLPQDAAMATLIAEHVSDMRMHEIAVTATPLGGPQSTSPTKP